MDGKSKKDIVAEIEKREKDAKKQEQKDKIAGQLELLNHDLNQIMAYSKKFVDANLADPKKLEELEKNFELARDVIKKGGTLTQLPTLDNIDEYAKIIKGENKPNDESPDIK